MTETEELPEDQDLEVDADIVDGTEDELFNAFVEIGLGKKKKGEIEKRSRILYTLVNKYKLDLKVVVIGLDNLGLKTTAGSLSGTLKAFMNREESAKKKAVKGAKKASAKSIEEKAVTVAEKDLSDRISKEIHDKITTDADMGDWIQKAYGPVANIHNCSVSLLIATAMEYWLFERPKMEALMEEILGDAVYKTAIMNDLVEAASPSFITLEKMKLMNQMTELVTLLRASGVEVPQNLLPAHMKALDQIENQDSYGM